jgi:cell division cycle protein 20 (cofactor of APC complex)
MATKVTSTMQFDIRKFNGRNNFNIWCIKMHALLVQQGLFKALKGVDSLPKGMNDEDK